VCICHVGSLSAERAAERATASASETEVHYKDYKNSLCCAEDDCHTCQDDEQAANAETAAAALYPNDNDIS